MDTFIRYLGGALNGKLCAVYKTKAGDIRIAAETTGGNPVHYQYKTKSGETIWTTLRHLYLTKEDYPYFVDRVTYGIVNPSDACITQRVLIELGYPESYFEA